MGLRDEQFYRSRVGKAATRASAMIRRMAIDVTTKALWSLLGTDGESEEQVEAFTGVGYYARPPEGANAEVILVKVGGSSQHPVIVATRDEDTRRAVVEARDLAADETIMHNSVAVVYVKADGTVHVKTAGGTALPLVTLDEHNTHVHPTGVGPSGVASPQATGTTAIMGE